MIPDREHQGKPQTNPIFTIVNPAAAEITACRLRQFLDDTKRAWTMAVGATQHTGGH